MASFVPSAFLTTEAEVRLMCAATGVDLGGVGSYSNAGACKNSHFPCYLLFLCSSSLLFTFVQLLFNFCSLLTKITPPKIPLTDLYASGKYAGKLYFSPNSDKSAMSKALNDSVKGAYRPGPTFPDTEAEAKTLAKQLGMSWGGTGAYKNHGACKLFLSSRIYT
jgi:hypothetical protein